MRSRLLFLSMTVLAGCGPGGGPPRDASAGGQPADGSSASTDQAPPADSRSDALLTQADAAYAPNQADGRLPDLASVAEAGAPDGDAASCAPQVVVAAGFRIECLARLQGPTSLAFAPTGSGFAAGLYVGVNHSTSVDTGSAPDEVVVIGRDGSSRPFARLGIATGPVGLKFGPAGSPWADRLVVSANNRDGGRSGDNGGALQLVDPAGAVSDATALGLPAGPGQPLGFTFPRSASFGNDLLLANSSFPPGDILRVSGAGGVGLFVTDALMAPAGLAPMDVEFAPGAPWGEDLYFADIGSSCRCIRSARSDGSFSAPLGARLAGDPRTLAFGPGGRWGTDLYVGTSSPGLVLRVTPQGQAQELVRGFSTVEGSDAILFDPQGDALYVADSSKGIFRITPRDP